MHLLDYLYQLTHPLTHIQTPLTLQYCYSVNFAHARPYARTATDSLTKTCICSCFRCHCNEPLAGVEHEPAHQPASSSSKPSPASNTSITLAEPSHRPVSRIYYDASPA